MDAVLQEIEQTEEGYVRDVEKLCSVFVAPLREEQALSKEEMVAVFSNCETIKGVNEGLLAALQEDNGDEDPVLHLAAAFLRMAPFLRCYAEYCANFVTANEVLAKLRANSPKVDAAFQRAEMAAKQTVGSMLIKPVQRLCKYPLLFRELCKEVPEDHPAHGEVLQAALEIKDVAAQINERVREAEQRSLMMSLAEAVREPELFTVAPTLAPTLTSISSLTLTRCVSLISSLPAARSCTPQRYSSKRSPLRRSARSAPSCRTGYGCAPTYSSSASPHTRRARHDPTPTPTPNPNPNPSPSPSPNPTPNPVPPQVCRVPGRVQGRAGPL